MSEIDDILKAMLSDNKNDNSTSEETSGTENEEKFTTDTDSDDIFGGINIDMFMKIGELMSKMSEQDRRSAACSEASPKRRKQGKNRYGGKAVQADFTASLS